MTNHDNQLAARRFAQGFGEALSESLTGAAGKSWRLTVREGTDHAAQSSSPVVFRLNFEGLLRGDCSVEFYDPQVRVLVAAICNHAAQAFGAEDGEALRMVISSAMTSFSASLFADYGAVTCKVERVAPAAMNDLLMIPLLAEGKDFSQMPVTFYLDGKLVESLSSGPRAKNVSEADKALFDPVNLNLVLDVELNMSLRFGMRKLPLREVLELSSGSVVELDRLVDDPVELLLDGRVIARGEAVIVDSNYGLRVTEITEPIAANFIR